MPFFHARRIVGRPGSSAIVTRAVAALALAGGLSAAGAAAQEASEATPETALRPVRLMTVSEPNTAVIRQFYGQVVALQTVDLAFQVGGQLTELPVRNGQSVAEGDLLASLDPDPFARAVERAELNLQQAQRDFDRVQQLAQSNVASEARFDEAQTTLDLAKISLREARDAQDDATLNAAFDGLVAQRLVANFTTVAQGTPVLRLHDMSEPRVQINVPERLFQRGQDPDGLRISADFGPDRPAVPLRLAEFTAETEGVAQSYRVDLALPPDAGFTPLPGFTATVTVRLPQGTDTTLSVPMTALTHGSERDTQVMVFDPTGADEGTVSPVTVAITSREGSEVGIDPGGDLQPGMEIVATGAHLLTDGQQVRRFTGFREAR